MNCSDFELIAACVAGIRVGGREEVDDDSVLRAMSHAAGCNRCSARLAEERALLAGVRAVVADLAAQEAPPSLEEALLAAFRLQSRTKVATAARMVPAWVGTRTARVFAAAGAVNVGGFLSVAFFRHPPAQVGPDRTKPPGAGPAPHTT